MLYTIAHFFRDKMGWLWNMIESINSQLFSIRYGKKLDELSLVEKPEGFEVIPIKDIPTEKLVMFFRNQPKETFMRRIIRLQDIVSIGVSFMDRDSVEGWWISTIVEKDWVLP